METKKHVFTPLEKKVFLDILIKYSSIVESKETDGNTLRAKNEAWDEITKEYNANRHVTIKVRSKQLRRLWMNLKQRQRGLITNMTIEPSIDSITTVPTFDRNHKNSVADDKYSNRVSRTEEIHVLEVELLRHKIREAKAKADLAELILSQERTKGTLRTGVTET